MRGRKPGPAHTSIMIRLPLTMLAKIDTTASAENSNRSEFVRRAIYAELDRLGQSESAAA